jgi:hypothetical protein
MGHVSKTKLTFAFLYFLTTFFLLPNEKFCFKNAEAGDRNSSKTETVLYGQKGKQVAKSFLKKLSQIPLDQIKGISLVYDIRLDCQWGVKIKMLASVKMKGVKNKYISTFKLTEPSGANLWGKFALFIYGRHTKEFKKLVEGIESTMDEIFHLEGGRFMTDELTEILPKRKRHKSRKGFKVFFDYNENRIKFWKERTQKDLTASEDYTGQVGPLTAYFNYLFYYQPEAEVSIINQQQCPNTSPGEEKHLKSGSDGICFNSQILKLKKNNTRKLVQYANMVCFGSNDFFDIVYGKNIYYNFSQKTSMNLKAPYAAFLDGIINKSKKREKAKRLEELQKQDISPELYRKKLQEIETMNILSAKNVRIQLKQTDVIF